jgi:phosphomannomutase
MSVRNCTYCITQPLEYNGYKVYWQDGGLESLQGRRNYYKYYETVTNQVVEANEDLIIIAGRSMIENASFFSPLKTKKT